MLGNIMNNFEFISYTPTPTDQYMLGIVKVKAYGKLELRYKHVKTRDGSGTFFCTSNYTLTDTMGEKKYMPCFLLDSRSDEELLMELIRQGVHQVINQKSARTTNSQGHVIRSMDEVAANEQLPF
jgi:hypothetical protein